MSEPLIIQDPVKDLGVALRDKHGGSHWVSLAELIPMVLRVLGDADDDPSMLPLIIRK